MMRKLRVEELNRKSVEDYKSCEKLPLVVVLDNIRSLHNVGSIFRTADALLVEKLMICGITSTPPSSEIHKTALGAELSVDWEYYKDTVNAVLNLKAQGYKIYVVEQVDHSIALQNFQYQGEKIAIVLGHEVFGVDQKVVNVSDAAIEIPQFGTKHSFNVSVSAGMVMWEMAKQMLFSTR